MAINATTRLIDVVDPVIFYDYLYQFSVKTSAFLKSGILHRAAEYDAMAGSKGSAVITPFLRPYVGRSQAWRADGTNTAEAIKQTSAQMAIPYIRRRAKMGWNNLAASIAGISGLYTMGPSSWGYNAIAQPGDMSLNIVHYITDFWNEDLQATIIAMLNGCFSSTTNVAGWTELNGRNPGLQDLTLNATLSSAQMTSGAPIGMANRISPVTIGGAQSLLSDRGGKIDTIAMHPTCYYTNILPNNLTLNQQTTSEVWNVPRYLDLDIILDDTLPVDRTNPLYPKYTNYMFAKNSIMFGDYKMIGGEGAELDRDVDQTEDFLTTRRKYLVQMAGMSYSGTYGTGGEGPSDADLSLPANWQRSDDIKNMGIVQLITNA